MRKEIKIKSDRRFGVELEVGSNNDYEEIQTALRFVENQDGFCTHNDSSIKGFNFCTEIVSPPLSGQADLDRLNLVVDKLVASGFTVNNSCGFHVHIDSTDLLSDFETIIVPVKELYDTFSKQKLERAIIVSGEAKAVNTNLLIEIANLLPISRLYAKHSIRTGLVSYVHGIKQFPQLKYKRLNCENMSFLTIQSTQLKESIVKVEKEFDILDQKYKDLVRTVCMRLGKSAYELSKSQIEKIAESTGQLEAVTKYREFLKSGGIEERIKNILEKEVVKDSDFAIVIKRKEDKHDRLKALLGFYVVFNDVMSSFVPKERRGNYYCKDLTSKYNFEEIKAIRSYEDFDKVWYKNAHLGQVRILKGNKYHESRYYMVNFHSLAKHKTIEIRSHSGTLNKRKIARWILLHQTIFDKIVNDPAIFEFLEIANSIKDSEAKADTFYKYLELAPEIEAELRGRARLFNETI